MSINLPLIEENIESSGFVLEHLVTEKLKANGWSVINGKYYIDDIAESVREIDLLAYKAKRISYKIGYKTEVFWIYTTLIISCKKNEKNLWTLLFRNYEEKNPNMDWHPIKLWTNHRVLEHMTSRGSWIPSYIDKIKNRNLYSDIFEPTGHLFAFQEVNKSTFKIQNDKQIFESVSSLMKAESYEMNSLKLRKKELALYSFNLISVLDTELVKLNYDGSKVDSSEIEEAKTTFNYIVDKKETSSRIHFSTFKNLDKVLTHYDELHSFNSEFFYNIYLNFYENIFFNDYYRIILNDFEELTIPMIVHRCKRHYGIKDVLDRYYFLRLNQDGILEMGVPEKSVEVLNEMIENGVSKSLVENELLEVFHYRGDFIFVDGEEIPF